MTTQKSNYNEDVITVLLVDDHPMVQSGLSACLSYYPDVKVIGNVNDGQFALEKALELILE